MNYRMHYESRNRLEILSLFILLLTFLIIPAKNSLAQAGNNSTGNGGRHTIQGRIFIESGRRASTQGLKVTVQSMGLGDLTAFVDGNGAFSFKNLVPGSYLVMIEDSDAFEAVRESVYIDAPAGSSSVSGLPRINTAPTVANVQIFLKPKRSETLLNEVLNAKWSAIPREAVQHFKRGLDFLQSGKQNEAEAAFRSSLAIAPNFAPAHTAIGTLELKMGKFENAVESLKQAIRYDAEDFEANVNLGIAYFNLNKMNEAEPFLVNAAFLNSFSVMPHYYLGLIFSVRNEAEVAQKAFEKVKDLDGGRSFPVIHKYLGRIYMHKQMNKAAVSAFETYLNLVPTAKDADAIRKDIADIKIRSNSTKYAPT